ncbi:GNAT family N-acetyltransferase [Nonomuraea sp. NEAU-A123]|uniref:GNAT family N-acetyltransferase n=1 Tax=Nonomuraea sp. NEAU-A123 TaxID=2839649 RepID=UPI001BE3FC02|nr:GNAT family N-acetyltransferase [Nonomuraea sp. NEAU-A123]MBT2233875.1 GNAT family N-acetyltransferase [Nonomuraea sp. NEAU-A123]
MLIEERTVADADLGGLLDAAFAELVSRYGAEGRSVVQAEARYLVAYAGARAAGCGAIQPAGPDTGELKRMYVAPAFRGRGIARMLLTALEDLAQSMGYQTVRLATGVRQPEAIALYESSGFVRVEPYGRYTDQPLTRCYEKALIFDPVRAPSWRIG